jgi:hypothetical protein
MPKAHDVAEELRKLADGLDKEPEAKITGASVYFSHWMSSDEEGDEKGKMMFLTLARLLPRPLQKQYPKEDDQGGDLELIYKSAAMHINANIPRSVVCHIVEPAKPAVYKCEPLLSEEDEKELTQAAK